MKHNIVHKEMLDLFYFSPYFYENQSEGILRLQCKLDDRQFLFSGNKTLLENLCIYLKKGTTETELKNLLFDLFGDKGEFVFEYMVLEGLIE